MADMNRPGAAPPATPPPPKPAAPAPAPVRPVNPHFGYEHVGKWASGQPHGALNDNAFRNAGEVMADALRHAAVPQYPNPYAISHQARHTMMARPSGEVTIHPAFGHAYPGADRHDEAVRQGNILGRFHMTPHAKAFLAAIQQAHDESHQRLSEKTPVLAPYAAAYHADQMPGLIFADWLDEHGHSNLADQIRNHHWVGRYFTNDREGAEATKRTLEMDEERDPRRQWRVAPGGEQGREWQVQSNDGPVPTVDNILHRLTLLSPEEQHQYRRRSGPEKYAIDSPAATFRQPAAPPEAGTAAPRAVTPRQPAAANVPAWQPVVRAGVPAWRHSTLGVIRHGPAMPTDHPQALHDAHTQIMATPPHTQVPKPGFLNFISGHVLPGYPVGQLHRLVGGQPGMHFVAQPVEHYVGEDSGHRTTPGTYPGIAVTGYGPALRGSMGFMRTLFRDQNGDLVAHHNLLQLRKKFRGGLGHAIFADAAKSLAEAGADRIENQAGRHEMVQGRPKQVWNGYAVWPKFGYDAPLDSYEQAALPPHLQGARTVQDLYGTPEGQAWWERHGQAKDMTFDLAPNSRSWQKLNAYRLGRGLAPVHLDPATYQAAREQGKAQHYHGLGQQMSQQMGHDSEEIRREAEALVTQPEYGGNLGLAYRAALDAASARRHGPAGATTEEEPLGPGGFIEHAQRGDTIEAYAVTVPAEPEGPTEEPAAMPALTPPAAAVPAGVPPHERLAGPSAVAARYRARHDIPAAAPEALHQAAFRAAPLPQSYLDLPPARRTRAAKKAALTYAAGRRGEHVVIGTGGDHDPQHPDVAALEKTHHLEPGFLTNHGEFLTEKEKEQRNLPTHPDSPLAFGAAQAPPGHAQAAPPVPAAQALGAEPAAAVPFAAVARPPLNNKHVAHPLAHQNDLASRAGELEAHVAAYPAPPDLPGMEGLAPHEAAVSSIPILYNPQMPKLERSAGFGRADVQSYMHQRSRQALGGKPLDWQNTRHPETREAVVNHATNLLTAETEAALRHPAKGEMHAAEWYRKSVAQARHLATLMHPELADDPRAWDVFAFALAITSQGQQVASNAKWANEVYQAWKDSAADPNARRFPPFGTGDKAPSMRGNFKKMNNLIDALGFQGAFDFINKKSTIGQLREEGYKTPSTMPNEAESYGSAIFGAKIGNGFYQNLRGNYEMLTPDMWFTRTFGRYFGNLKDDRHPLIQGQLDRLAGELNSPSALDNPVVRAAAAEPGGLKAILDDPKRSLDLAVKIYNDWDVRQKFKHGTELQKAARTLRKTLRQSKDVPTNKRHYTIMNEAMRRTVQRLKERGHDVNVADVQALLWYPEQDLYGKLGSPPRFVDRDYAAAFTTQARDRGVPEAAIQDALKRGLQS